MATPVNSSSGSAASAGAIVDTRDGPISPIIEGLEALAETFTTRARSSSVFEPSEGAAASSAAIAFSSINPIPQLNIFKQTVFDHCSLKTYGPISDTIESIEAARAEDWGSHKERIVAALIASMIDFSFEELDVLETALNKQIKELYIRNLRELALKVKHFKSLVDASIISKEHIISDPIGVKALALEVALDRREWDVAQALIADCNSGLALTVINKSFEKIETDMTASTKFLATIQRISRLIGDRYQLKGLEKQLSDWVVLKV